MSTRYINPADSQSAHAVKDKTLIATPAVLCFIVKVLGEIPTAQRKRIATAINIAGNKSMSSFPAFLEPIFFYGLTQDFEVPWVYHPYHATPDVSVEIIKDVSVAIEERLEVARVMLKHDDRAMRQWATSAIRESFTAEEQASLGLTPSEPKVKPNVVEVDPAEALAKSLGITKEELLARLMATQPTAVVSEDPKAKAK